jgi:hypothetical protein
MSSSSVLKKYLLRHRFLSLDGRLDDLINSLRLVSGQRWLDGHLVRRQPYHQLYYHFLFISSIGKYFVQLE